MPRFLLKLAFLITLTLTITSLAARILGSTQPPNPALRGFTEGCEDKPQPCWYGIVPGVTDKKRADDLLIQYHYPSQCVNIGNTDEIVIGLELWPCAILPPLYFGDVVGQLGHIEGLGFIPQYSDIIQADNLVPFEHRFVLADLDSIYWLKDRFMTIVSVRISAAPIQQTDLKWYGNIPRWKLCQLEPNYYVCRFCKALSNEGASGVCK